MSIANQAINQAVNFAINSAIHSASASASASAIVKEVKIGDPTTFQTIISIKGDHLPKTIVELKFETLFGKAKDPSARQTKGQFFVTHSELIALRNEINAYIKQSEPLSA